MIIDSHQHFWQITRGDYGWLTPALKTLYRDFLPYDFTSIMQQNNIDGTILVQAAPTIDETYFMLELAEKHDFIKGVVGWVDFEYPNVGNDIAHLATYPKLKGIRPMIQDIADPQWMLKPQCANAFEHIIKHHLVFDALVLPQHLPFLYLLITRYPTLRMVVDHGAKPLIKDNIMVGWREDIQKIADDYPYIYCKLSGLVTEAKHDDWSDDDIQPYAQHLLDIFTPKRLMWGSDWPVCTLASNYDRWLNCAQRFCASLRDDDKHKIFAQNAIDIYGLE